MADDQVRLVNQAKDLDQTIVVPEEQYILDIAQTSGICLPAGCYAGVLLV